MSYDQEYFCPHCGAILNDQPGFDPDNGTWTCTECGQMLMDDDVYNGDTYEGVAWFCDNCGALLNRQDGFSDSYGSWICTECGHVNGTTDDDIINGFKCPRCGATLDVQSCFNKYDDDWECTECGAHLHHDYSDDEYEEVEEPKHRCPNCDADLDDQWGFSEYDDDWKCTECGAHLHHNYSDDEYEVVEEDNDDEDDDDEDDDTSSSYSDYDSGSSNSYSSESYSRGTYQSTPRAQKTTYSPPRTAKKKKGHFGIILILLLILAVIGYGGRGFFTGKTNTGSHPGEIKLTYSASSYKDENYYNAIIKLEKQGLTDIRLTPLNDLKTGILSKAGKIVTIEINGLADFQSGSWVSEDSVVSITYHSFEKKEKDGYDTDKNNHLILNGVDISLPTYFIEDSQDGVSAVYHVKGDDETNLKVLFDKSREWKGISQYDTHFIQKEEHYSSVVGAGDSIIALAKKNDKVYIIHVISLQMESDGTYLHLVMISPDTCKTDYTTDFEAIVSGIYIPQASEVRVEFTSKDYKGKAYEEVVAELRNMGFSNIQAENLKDIVLGIFAKEGTVESISINGNTDYKVGDWISNQAEIVITYHGKK